MRPAAAIPLAGVLALATLADHHPTPSPQTAIDLVVSTAVSVTPTTLVPGSSVTLSAWTVKNVGGTPAGGFSYGFYLSKDSTITPADTRLGGGSLGSLDAGAQFNAPTSTLLIPASTPLGAYYVGVLVDEGNGVAESNEGNNFRSVAVTVALAELKVTTPLTVTPSGISRGGNITLSRWSVRNEGPATSAQFNIGVYLSYDPIITSNDIPLTSYQSGPLDPGASFDAAAANLTVPGPLPGESGLVLNFGTIYVGILADTGNSTPESNEGNNFVSVPLEVFEGPSDRTPVWRVQVRLTTGDVKHAGTDDDVNIRLTSTPDSTWIDYSRNDFEKGDAFTYDLGFANGVTKLGDIQMLQVTKLGSDDWCLKKVELIVNDDGTRRLDRPDPYSPGVWVIPVFSRTFEPCKWLNAAPTIIPGIPPRVQQNSVSLTIPYAELRQDAKWRYADPPYIPPFYAVKSFIPPGRILRQELESRIESAVGDALFRSPTQVFGAWSGRAKWGRFHGRAVEASKTPRLNRIHVDLDLVIDISGGPDAELDVDFDIEMSCVCGDFRTTITQVKVGVDSRWYSEALTLGVIQFLDNYLGKQIQDAIRSSFAKSSSLNLGSTYCPLIEVEATGEPPASIRFSSLPDGPDLILPVPAQVTPEGVAPGAAVKLSPWTVLNKGTLGSNAFSTGVYLKTIGGLPTTSDIRLGGVSGRPLGACSSITQPGLTVTIPSSTPAGSYGIFLFVDEMNQTQEVEERNNASVVSLEVGYADLTINSCEQNPIVGVGGMLGYVRAGETVTISQSVVGNLGVIASNPFSIGFYLSADEKITRSDLRLGGTSAAPLPPTKSKTDFLPQMGPVGNLITPPFACHFNRNDALVLQRQTLTIPSSTTPGDYYIGILVDESDEIFEGPGETNNFVAAKIHVQ